MNKEKIEKSQLTLETVRELPVGKSLRGHIFRGAASDFEFCENMDEDWLGRASRTYVVKTCGGRIKARLRLLYDGRYRLTVTTTNRLEPLPINDFLELQQSLDEMMNYLSTHLKLERKV